MSATKYARLVRVCDERNRGEPTSSVCGRLEALIAAGVHKSQKPYKRQHTDAPYRGQPVAAIGAHGHDDIAMFGAYAGLAWRPNRSPTTRCSPRSSTSTGTRTCTRWIRASSSASWGPCPDR
jgi:hypothetical protein